MSDFGTLDLPKIVTSNQGTDRQSNNNEIIMAQGKTKLPNRLLIHIQWWPVVTRRSQWWPVVPLGSSGGRWGQVKASHGGQWKPVVDIGGQWQPVVASVNQWCPVVAATV